MYLMFYIICYIFHLFYYLFTIYLKVKIVRLNWRGIDWQLGNSWRKALPSKVTPSKVCFPLIYIFCEVIFKSRIDGTRSYLEDLLGKTEF